MSDYQFSKYAVIRKEEYEKEIRELKEKQKKMKAEYLSQQKTCKE